ncbi:MAG: LuxR C-terminal-related transcriptional regulator [Pseudohongiellaceae bacterium]
MIHSSTQFTPIHKVWDRLAELPASRSEESLRYLLEQLGKLLKFHRGWWLGAFRMRMAPEGDPALGWRPGPIVFLQEHREDADAYEQELKLFETGDVAETVVEQLRYSGHFRVKRLRELASPDYFDSDHFRARFTDRGFCDSMIVATPINRHTETYFCFYRMEGQPLFSDDDVALAAYALRGLKWFHRQVLLSFGMLIAESPLTPTERKVLTLLLTDRSEKQIAIEMRQRPATTHEYILKVYRKFNIHSRAGLTALWLGQTPTD